MEAGRTDERLCFFFSSRRRHTRLQGDWSSDVCSSDLPLFNRRFTGEESRPADSNWQTERREPLPTRSECDGTIFDRRNEFDQKMTSVAERSEERRVGKEGRSRWSPYH